jgi:hypothetical protein
MTYRAKTLSVLILFSLFAFAIPVVADTINGCVEKSGGLRVVLAGQPCKNSEFAISWNSVGPQGLPGVNGTNGAKGDTGAQGPPGDACSKPVLIGMIQIESGPMIPIYQVKGGVEVRSAIVGGGGSTGKAIFSPFEVLKAIDANSPDLFKACVNGNHLLKVKITINATTTSPAEVFELENVVISSYSIAPSCSTVLESVTFDFSKIRITAGGSTICFDLIKGTSC